MSDTRLSRVAGFLVAGCILVFFFAHASGSETSAASSGPLFAVIPTLGIGAPLAILALLFPSLFGGVLVLFRQWSAFFMVISINSLLYCLQLWCASWLAESFWGTQMALWLAVTLVTLLGAAWAWRRNVTALKTGNVPDAPPRTEHLVLWLLSVCCAGMFAYVIWTRMPITNFSSVVMILFTLNNMWSLVLVMSLGLWVGLVYKLYRAKLARGSAAGDLPTEGVMLGTMLAGCILFLSTQATPHGDTSEVAAAPGQLVAKRDVNKKSAVLLERFDPFYGTVVGQGTVFSSPLIVTDHVYLAIADTDEADRTKGRGAVLCIDRHSKKILWTFNDDGKMQPVYSSPFVSNNKLYIGEGFHYNPNCKVYCLDAKTGKKLWDFTTNSQTESTPTVAGGKVFIGGGNDGVYALDAATGQKLWQYGQRTPIFRVGAGPAAARGRVFVGSGVDREHPEDCETALVSLDAETGKEKWKVKVNLPCWATPVVAGDVVFFTLGSGDIYSDGDETPGGAVLCLEAKTGKQLWRYDVDKPVHTKPALDGQSVFFGCRDGHCYCLNRFDGKPRWKKFAGSPIFASPVLDQGALTGHAKNVFVVAQGDMNKGTGGTVSCLDAVTGQAHWSYHDLEQRDAFLASSPAVVSIPTPAGIHREIYFGVWMKTSNEPYLYCLEDLLTTGDMKKGDAE